MTEIESVRRPWLELKTIVDRDGNWTQIKLAAATGYTRQQVHNLLTGRSRPTPPAIRKFAAAVGVPYSVLEPREGAANGPLGYSIDDTADMLNVGRPVVEAMITDQQMQVYVVGGQVRIRAEEIDRIVAGDAA
jgi:excisionase family DNA binding protein